MSAVTRRGLSLHFAFPCFSDIMRLLLLLGLVNASTILRKRSRDSTLEDSPDVLRAKSEHESVQPETTAHATITETVPVARLESPAETTVHSAPLEPVADVKEVLNAALAIDESDGLARMARQHPMFRKHFMLGCLFGGTLVFYPHYLPRVAGAVTLASVDPALRNKSLRAMVAVNGLYWLFSLLQRMQISPYTVSLVVLVAVLLSEGYKPRNAFGWVPERRV